MKRKNNIAIFLLCALSMLLLSSCGAKKKAAESVQTIKEEPAQPTWHTCLIQGARATVTTDEDKISASITMQTVRDSMIVISIMPMLGIEMARLEATPTGMIAIDKMHGRYAKATFAELNRKLTPNLNWDILQQIASAELPTGDEKARLMYSFGDETVEIVINYAPRKIDVPVRVTNQRLEKYTQVDISQWL